MRAAGGVANIDTMPNREKKTIIELKLPSPLSVVGWLVQFFVLVAILVFAIVIILELMTQPR